MLHKAAKSTAITAVRGCAEATPATEGPSWLPLISPLLLPGAMRQNVILHGSVLTIVRGAAFCAGSAGQGAPRVGKQTLSSNACGVPVMVLQLAWQSREKRAKIGSARHLAQLLPPPLAPLLLT